MHDALLLSSTHNNIMTAELNSDVMTKRMCIDGHLKYQSNAIGSLDVHTTDVLNSWLIL